ncbi:MAG TPA: PQQ-dependent sugar dehydrogenase [Planctomycetota bacterium]
MKRVLPLALLLALPLGAAVVPAGFSDAVYVGGLSSPTSMAFAPDGRLFVTEKGGAVRVITAAGALLPTPFLTLPVETGGERGVEGVAFDPQFAVNGFVYVYHTVSTPTIHNRLSRFTANGNTALAGSELILMDLDTAPTMFHNGGALHFGVDGHLYVAVGDGGPSGNGQNLSNRFGKILRIEPDGSIPADNPTTIAGVGMTSGVNRAIWCAGLRNPFTFAIQPGTGRIFVNDVGQATWEEVNEAVAGANYGWPMTEGDFAQASFPSFTRPLTTYGHDGVAEGTGAGEAITGGVFYPQGGAFPAAYHGLYFFADLTNRWIRTLDPAGNATAVFATGANQPIDLDVGADGALYYLEFAGGAAGQGRVNRIAYTAGTAPAFTLPPADRVVGLGQDATFTVSASGTAPIAYQWQRGGIDIPGATSASYTLTGAQAADDGAQIRCRATNPVGNATSPAATLTVLSNQAPAASIAAPPSYAAGDTVVYFGTASDAEDGPLAGAAHSWRVDFHHGTHLHPFTPDTAGSTSGQFTVPLAGETAVDVWYRITLTVTDSAGLSTTVTRDVPPVLSAFTLATDPPGLQVTLDGATVGHGTVVDGVLNQTRTLGIPAVPGYAFTGWSDGGAATHDVATSPAVYTATFQATGGSGSSGGGACGALGLELLLVWLLGRRRR